MKNFWTRRAALKTAGRLALGLLAALTPSCHSRSAPAPAPTCTKLPTSPGVIRVRLVDPTHAVTLSSSGPYRLLLDGRCLARSCSPLTKTPLRRDASGWSFRAAQTRGSILRLEPADQTHLVGCNGRMYRGALIIRVDKSDRTRMTVDNHVPLEHYLAGVLARELLRGWSLETYKALAVTARTYAMYEMGHIGRRRGFDVYADQRSQVYGGVADETAKSLAAVRQTWGFVLTVGPPGAERVFKTYYSSCCGGVTAPADGLEKQVERVRPLAGGVVCDDCDFSSRRRWPTVRIAKADAFAALARCYGSIAAMGPLREIRVYSATSWGRPQWLEVIAVNGAVHRIRADDLRLALLRAKIPAAKGLYSMNCAFGDDGGHLVFSEGKGFGHGVGLCQYGAEGKARRGLHYHEILYAYFPGARIYRAY